MQALLVNGRTVPGPPSFGCGVPRHLGLKLFCGPQAELRWASREIALIK